MDQEIYDFIHIPKTAGCSFYSLIELHSDKISYKGHNRATKNKSIAIVRNPYDRLVSCYFYYINNKELEQSLPEYRSIAMKYKDFEDFILNISRHHLMKKLIHLKPMHYWVCDEHNRVMVEKIFKIENPQLIDSFLQSIGIKGKIGNIRKNTSSHSNYMKYMNEEITDEINRLYSMDFKIFNYKKA